MVVGILCLNFRHDYWKFLDIVPYQQSTGKSLPWLICVSTRNSKRVSEDICFIWQSAWSPPRKYFMIGLTITRAISRNKKDVVIVLKMHEKVAQSMVLEFITIVFKSSIVLYGIVWLLNIASDNSDMYNMYYSVR